MPLRQVSDSDLSLRPASRDDVPFLFELYANSRRDEVSGFGWDQEQQTAFFNLQFTARQKAYRIQYPAAKDSVILCKNERAGRLITVGSTDAIVVVDIAIAPQFRRRGVASKIIKCLQAEAFQKGVKLILRVNKENLPAFELYFKMGFVIANEDQILYSMSWDGGDTTEVGGSE